VDYEGGEQVNNIEAERGRKGLSKEALSRELGITSKTYRKYISGYDIPSGTLLDMCRIFNCTTDYLLGRTNTISDRNDEMA